MEITIDYKQSLDNLENISKVNLNDPNSYTEVQKLLKTTIIPFNLLTLKKGKYLFRARRNNKNETFTSKTQISYRKDTDRIKEFGRANEPGQSIFYSSHRTETSLFETSSLFNIGNLVTSTEIITLGKWYVSKDIDLLGIISDKRAMTQEPSLNNLFTKSLNHPLSDEFAQKILEFFSQEFSKNVMKNSNQYKISCAYFNHIIKLFNYKRLMGVVYPSVENEYRDLNVALLPKAVDSSLILETVAEYEVNTKNMTVFQIGLADIYRFNQKKIEL
jgi:hypothetical protein